MVARLGHYLQVIGACRNAFARSWQSLAKPWTPLLSANCDESVAPDSGLRSSHPRDGSLEDSTRLGLAATTVILGAEDATIRARPQGRRERRVPRLDAPTS